MVHGDKRKFLSALVTLNEENARKWAAEHGLPRRRGALPRPGADRADPAGDRRAQRPAAELRHHQAVRVLPRDFTQETGELTPTLKVKRKVVTEKHQALLDSFYAE